MSPSAREYLLEALGAFEPHEAELAAYCPAQCPDSYIWLRSHAGGIALGIGVRGEERTGGLGKARERFSGFRNVENPRAVEGAIAQACRLVCFPLRYGLESSPSPASEGGAHCFVAVLRLALALAVVEAGDS